MTVIHPTIQIAQQDAAPSAPVKDDSPAAKYARRYPQKARVGDLIGLPVNDDDDRTLGHIRQIVRSPDGSIKLIVSYSRWFGWFGHPVAVPLEVVAIYGRQLASLEMKPDEYKKAPTWVEGRDTRLGDNETIRVALMRR
jgi:hypothetical protein